MTQAGKASMIEVADLKHLTNIIAALRATPQVSTVSRVRG